MRKAIEFTVDLLASAFAWVILFPLLGVTRELDSGSALIATVFAYAALTNLLGGSFFFVEQFINVRRSRNTVLFCTFIGLVVAPYIAIVLAEKVVGGLVVSHVWLVPAVVLSAVVNYSLNLFAGPLRKRADHIASLRSVKLMVTDEGAYVPVIRNGKLESGSPLVLDPIFLDEADVDVKLAMRLGIAKDWEQAEMLMVRAIPELEACGRRGIPQLQAACLVMKQSFAAVNLKDQVQLYDEFHGVLAMVLEKRGPF